MLFKKQRNEFFEKLTEIGFNANDFEEKFDNGNRYEIISSKDSRFKYDLLDSNSTSQFKASFTPSGVTDTTHFALDKWSTWENAMRIFAFWLRFLKDEIETPDLWADAQANAKLFALNPAVPDEVFNAVELRQLEGQVRQLVQGLASLALPAQAQKVLTATVEEIPEKATRFTKKELTGWFMGAFAAQVTSLALSQEHISAIAHLIKTTFMGLLQLH